MSARGPSPQGGGVRTPSNSVGRGWEREAEGAGRTERGRHALALPLGDPRSRASDLGRARSNPQAPGQEAWELLGSYGSRPRAFR